MVPPDLGVYTVDDRPNPGCEPIFSGFQERAPRRNDVLKPTWGKGGIPTQDTCRSADVPNVLARHEMRPLQELMTEQGPVKLPYGPDTLTGYMPSDNEFQTVVDNDTRRTGISNRYYR